MKTTLFALALLFVQPLMADSLSMDVCDDAVSNFEIGQCMKQLSVRVKDDYFVYAKEVTEVLLPAKLDETSEMFDGLYLTAISKAIPQLVAIAEARIEADCKLSSASYSGGSGQGTAYLGCVISGYKAEKEKIKAALIFNN